MRIYSNPAAAVAYLLCFFVISAFSQQDPGHGGEEPLDVKLVKNQTIVPMTIYGNKPVVDVKINGKGPFKFFLDTGAGVTVFSQELADELKLVPDGTRNVGDPANPQAIEAKKNIIGKLEIGDAAFSKFVALSFDRTGLYQPGAPRGVLGIPLFSKLLLTIDYPKSQIVLEKGSLSAADGKKIVDFNHSEGGIFSLPLVVGGKETQATIDTGSSGGISFPETSMDKLALAGKPVEVGRGRTVGGESVIYGAKFAGEIALGEYKWKEPEVRFFNRLNKPNLGFQFLSAFAITIDQQNMRMRFEKGAETAVQKTEIKTGTAAGPLAEFAGLYGERRITVENENIFLQRIAGPNGEGPKIKLVQIKPGEFALEGQTEVRIKFARNSEGKVESVNVLTPAGAWETSKRT